MKESAVESPGIPPERDLASDLGVPGSDADDRRRPPYVRDPGGSMVQLSEVQPSWRRQPQQVTLDTRAGHDAAKKLSQRPPRWVLWLVWGWPSPDEKAREWRMPIGERNDRYCLQGCLPADGVELVKAGAKWRISTQPSLTLQPMPEWIAALLGGNTRTCGAAWRAVVTVRGLPARVAQVPGRAGRHLRRARDDRR